MSAEAHHLAMGNSIIGSRQITDTNSGPATFSRPAHTHSSIITAYGLCLPEKSITLIGEPVRVIRVVNGKSFDSGRPWSGAVAAKRCRFNVTHGRTAQPTEAPRDGVIVQACTDHCTDQPPPRHARSNIDHPRAPHQRTRVDSASAAVIIGRRTWAGVAHQVEVRTRESVR
jgi:hypothetical protein